MIMTEMTALQLFGKKKIYIMQLFLFKYLYHYYHKGGEVGVTTEVSVVAPSMYLPTRW